MICMPTELHVPSATRRRCWFTISSCHNNFFFSAHRSRSTPSLDIPRNTHYGLEHAYQEEGVRTGITAKFTRRGIIVRYTEARRSSGRASGTLDMFSTLGIKAEQIYGDVYHSWLRDTFEKNTPDSKALFREMVEGGFRDRQIILRRQRLGANVMNSLATMLHRSPLTKLDVNGNALRDTGCMVLSHLLHDLPNLTYLDLGANDLGPAGAQALGLAIAQHKKLSVLILSSRRDDPYANHITPGGATILLEGCLRSRSLRYLDLGGNPIAVELPAVAADQDDVISAAAASAGDGNKDLDAHLEPGSSSGGSMHSRRPIHLLEQLLVRPSCSLTTLRLSQVGLTAAGALRLVAGLSANTSLSLLDLSDNRLPPVVGDALGRLLLDRVAMRNAVALTTLILSGNQLFGEGPEDASGGSSYMSRPSHSKSIVAKRLQAAQQLASPSSTIGNGSGGLTPSSSTSCGYQSRPEHLILSALTNDRVLTTLELNSCGMDGRAVRILCHSLMNNMALQTLGLRRNGLDADTAVLLGRALCRHPSICRVSLSHNAIEDEGACALATVVGYNESLEVLDLQNTWLGDRGLVALGMALQSNHTLRVLLLGENHFTDKGGDAFAALLEKNTSVLRCQLGATSVPYRTVLRLERATARNTSLMEHAEPDALRRELVRLHYQKYKLEEAKIELDNLRDKNAEVKRSTENFELQAKQDQSDLTKRMRELEEQAENHTAQELKHHQQCDQLEADLQKANKMFLEDMEVAKGRLEAENHIREKVEEEYRAVEAELEGWKTNAAAREASKREHLANTYKDMEKWSDQRKAYHEQGDEMLAEVRALEAAEEAQQKKKGSTRKSRKSQKAKGKRK